MAIINTFFQEGIAGPVPRHFSCQGRLRLHGASSSVKLPEARQTAYAKEGELTVKLPEARQIANTNFGDLSVKLPEARQTANINGSRA
jgi:hypothetical protein